MTEAIDHAAHNRAHFDKIAHQYDEYPLALALTRKHTQALLAAYEFDEEATVVMEYACGTGECCSGLPRCAELL